MPRAIENGKFPDLGSESLRFPRHPAGCSNPLMIPAVNVAAGYPAGAMRRNGLANLRGMPIIAGIDHKRTRYEGGRI